MDLKCPSAMILFLALIHLSLVNYSSSQCDPNDVNCTNNANYTLVTPQDNSIDTNSNVTREANETITSNENRLKNVTGSPSAKKRKEKRRKTLTWLWILLSVIIMFLIAVIALLFCWKEKKPDEKEGLKAKSELMKTESKTSNNPTSASQGTSPSLVHQPSKTPSQPATKVSMTEPSGSVKASKVPSDTNAVSKDTSAGKDGMNNVDVKNLGVKDTNVKKSSEEVKKPPQNSGSKASSQVPIPQGHN